MAPHLVALTKAYRCVRFITFTHARARAHTHTHTHKQTNTRTHARARTHTLYKHTRYWLVEKRRNGVRQLNVQSGMTVISRRTRKREKWTVSGLSSPWTFSNNKREERDDKSDDKEEEDEGGGGRGGREAHWRSLAWRRR